MKQQREPFLSRDVGLIEHRFGASEKKQTPKTLVGMLERSRRDWTIEGDLSRGLNTTTWYSARFFPPKRNA